MLDVGSHYLHQSCLLSVLGYEVTGLDVAVFAEAPFVVDRAQHFGVRNEVTDDLSRGEFLSGRDGTFDVVIFTEILEHITFNPVRFWRRIYDLLAPGGVIYVTTPNSLRAAALIRSTMRLVSLDGIGPTIDEIFDNVTYGHHWKEYSAREITRYFQALSSDFEIRTSHYAVPVPDPSMKQRLRAVFDLIPRLRPEVEAIVRLPAKTGFDRESPELPI